MWLKCYCELCSLLVRCASSSACMDGLVVGSSGWVIPGIVGSVPVSLLYHSNSWDPLCMWQMLHHHVWVYYGLVVYFPV